MKVILEVKVVGETVVVVVQEDEHEVIYCYYCKESGHTKYNCPLLQEKQQQSFQSADVAATYEEQSDSRSFISEEQMKGSCIKCPNSFRLYTSPSSTATLAWTGNNSAFSYFIQFFCLDYRFGSF